VRRQTGHGGGASAGSGCVAQLDPPTLPLAFEARDARADGHVRRVELARDCVTVRRAVRGITMTIRVNVADFLGVVLHGDADHAMLTLEHRDPALSIPLQECADEDTLSRDWQAWAELFALPRLIADDRGQLHNPFARGRGAPRRRRCNAIAQRRPRILMRRKPKGLGPGFQVHENEREIIARN